MQPSDGMDDMTRLGANSLRAEINRLRKQNAAKDARIDEAVADADRAKADAKALSEFILSRNGPLRVWEHTDVLRLVSLLVQGTILRLQAQVNAFEAKGMPASHLLYQRLTESMREETAKEIAALCTAGLARPDNVSEAMAVEVLKLLRLGETR